MKIIVIFLAVSAIIWLASTSCIDTKLSTLFSPNPTTPSPEPPTSPSYPVTIISPTSDEIPQFPAPWSDVSAYTVANPDITVNTGTEFAIGFDTNARASSYWTSKQNEGMISLVGIQNVSYPPDFNPAATWFRFKALQAGQTQITFNYFAPGGAVIQDQRTFNITIN